MKAYDNSLEKTLGICCAIAIAFSIYQIIAPETDSAGSRDSQQEVATVHTLQVQSEAVRRPNASLRWNAVNIGNKLVEGDTLFIGPQSQAELVLNDQTHLKLGENTLIVLKLMKNSNQEELFDLDLLKGEVEVRKQPASSKPLQIRLGKKTIQTKQRTAFAVTKRDSKIQISAPNPTSVAITDTVTQKEIPADKSEIALLDEDVNIEQSSIGDFEANRIPNGVALDEPSEKAIEPVKEDIVLLTPSHQSSIQAQQALQTLNFSWSMNNKHLKESSILEFSNTQGFERPLWSVAVPPKETTLKLDLSPKYYAFSRFIQSQLQQQRPTYWRIKNGTSVSRPFEFTFLSSQFADVQVNPLEVKYKKSKCPYAAWTMSVRNRVPAFSKLELYDSKGAKLCTDTLPISLLNPIKTERMSASVESLALSTQWEILLNNADDCFQWIHQRMATSKREALILYVLTLFDHSQGRIQTHEPIKAWF